MNMTADVKEDNRYAHDAAKWQAVSGRDASADGRFVFAVKTTGIYCRPSCSARAALRKNVRFFANAAAAEQAGFRPCKRCAPDGPTLNELHATVVAKACRYIESAEQSLPLRALAKRVGICL